MNAPAEYEIFALIPSADMASTIARIGSVEKYPSAAAVLIG